MKILKAIVLICIWLPTIMACAAWTHCPDEEPLPNHCRSRGADGPGAGIGGLSSPAGGDVGSQGEHDPGRDGPKDE